MKKRERHEKILNAKSAPIGGVALMVIGAGVLAFGAYGVIAGDDELVSSLVLTVISLAAGLGLLRGGHLLLIPKGGLDLIEEPGRSALAWRGVGDDDRLRISLDDVESVRLVPRDEIWKANAEVRNWSCELVLTDGCAIVGAESANYESIWALGRALQHTTHSRLDEQSSWCEPALPDETHSNAGREPDGRLAIRAGRWGRLQETLLGSGLVAATSGGVLMSQVAQAPVFGFLFGPTLFFMGLAFLGATFVGGFGRDEIYWDATKMGRRSRLGPLSWGKKELHWTDTPYVRIQHRGLLGASLELVGPKSTVVLVGGVSGRSSITPTTLRKLAIELNRIKRLSQKIDPRGPETANHERETTSQRDQSA